MRMGSRGTNINPFTPTLLQSQARKMVDQQQEKDTNSSPFVSTQPEKTHKASWDIVI